MTSAGGSYGFGKAAYYNVSRISTVLVSTQTPEGKNFFEGVSSICTHEYEGKKRTHVGYYDNNDGEPVTELERIPKRFKRELPGTSVFIAGVDQNEGYQEIISAVLTHFWLSILEGKLTVSIKLNNEGNLFPNEEPLEISKKTLDELIYKTFQDEQDNIRGHSNPRPYYEAVKFADTDKSHILIKDYLPECWSATRRILPATASTGFLSVMTRGVTRSSDTRRTLLIPNGIGETVRPNRKRKEKTR